MRTRQSVMLVEGFVELSFTSVRFDEFIVAVRVRFWRTVWRGNPEDIFSCFVDMQLASLLVPDSLVVSDI
jgi:hypothetical protein